MKAAARLGVSSCVVVSLLVAGSRDAVASPREVETPVTAIVVSETIFGGDLNGDGDTLDSVVHVFRAADGVTVNLGLAAEAAQGLTDLNGDGDLFDAVLFVLKPPSQKAMNLGLAAATVFGPFGSRNPLFAPTRDGHTLTVLVGEDDQGEVDLNGNGIIGEHVPFAVHIRSGKARLADVQ